MHNGFITVDNVKMAKSAGNFFTVRDVAQQFGYEPIRMLMLSTQYRSPINYSFDAIEQCKASLTRLYNCRDGIDFEIQNASHGEVDKELEKTLEERRNQFIEAMDDDLNTAAALAAVFDAVRDINSAVVGRNASVETCKLAADIFDELTGVLGLVYNRKKETLDSDIDAMIEARANARKEKYWAAADRIRDELKAMGIVLEDTPQGVKWHRE
ncbi:MAG: cysteine--tRNA ligase, partial [Clostridia bacterium]|nr:cysteine--tRNA ligase [Clostridia bacterium]